MVPPEVALLRARLWRDPSTLASLGRAFAEDPEGYIQALRQLSENGEEERFLQLARVPEAQDRLDPRQVKQLRRALIARGRFDEALELFESRPRGDHPQVRLEHAQALEGAGRWREALALTNEVLAAAPDLQGAEELRAQLERLIEAEARFRADPHWSDLALLIRDALERGRTQAACDQLCAALEMRTPAPSMAEALRLARSLLPRLDEAAARRLVAALAALEPFTPEAAALQLVLSGAEPPPMEEEDLAVVLAEVMAALGQRTRAIRALGRLAAEREREDEVRLALARMVGDDVLQGVSFAATPARLRPRKVFDLFRFNDEVEILKIKLHEMADWVDHFVIVESRRTFRGAPKPLVFEANRDQFAAFEPKIIHVVLGEAPEHVDTAWAREFLQRDHGLNAIAPLCDDEDLIILSDVDEVFDARAVAGFGGEYASLKTQTFMYFLNYRQVLERRAQRGNASIWRAAHLRRVGPSWARHMLSAYRIAPRIHDAGWHFTSVGPAAHIAGKVRSYSHAEYEGKDESFFARRIAKIMSGRADPNWERWEIDERFPAYIRDNQEALAGLIL